MGTKLSPMDNETRQFGRHGDDVSDASSRYLSPSQSSSQSASSSTGQSAPRQFMPGEGDSRYSTSPSHPETKFGDSFSSGGLEPYDEPYRPESSDSGKSRGGAGSIVLAVLALLLGLAAIAMFFLWRGAESRANKPDPAPVTITQTETVTTTPTGLLDELFGSDGEKDDKKEDGEGGGENSLPLPGGEGAPSLPENLPTEIPDDIPEEYRDDAEDLLNQLDGLLNG